MPASGGDSVAIALRFGFSSSFKLKGNIDSGIEASAKRVLESEIKLEPSTCYKATVLGNLKAKYTVINTKASNSSSTNGEKSNGTNHVKKNNATLPTPKRVLFPAERVQLGFRAGVTIGSGMVNLGNTCYLNSTLQALFHVPAFVNWLLSEPSHLKCEQFSDFQIHPDDITCAVIKTLKCSQSKTGSAMKPTCIFNKLKAICKHLTQGSQEDAHEFMRYLLESLEKGYIAKVQGQNLESWSKETTPINQIFGGYMRTEVTCLSCHAISTTFQHFQDLPLDIRKASTLDEALTGYFAREPLPGGEDAYKCEKCCRKVVATKKFSVERPPNVLCVQLKRFSPMNGKLTKQVDLPKLLNLSPFLSLAVRYHSSVRYRLVSVVTHIGQSVNCGHYTAIAMASNGCYYQFDDGVVRQVPPHSVHNTSGAYLVLYELETPFLPSMPRPSPEISSETASTGGTEAKEPRRSPTAGSPAPPTCPTPQAALTSLVPYESDAESENEEKTEGARKIIPTSKPVLSGTSTWSVTNVQSRTVDGSQNGPGTSIRSNGQQSIENKFNGKVIVERNHDTQRPPVHNELMQNTYFGFGHTNKIRSWEGGRSNFCRQIENERKMGQKRTYSDNFNLEYDRGKMKKGRFIPRDNGRRPTHNIFQRRANHQHDHFNNRWLNGSRRPHHRPYYPNNYHKQERRQEFF